MNKRMMKSRKQKERTTKTRSTRKKVKMIAKTAMRQKTMMIPSCKWLRVLQKMKETSDEKKRIEIIKLQREQTLWKRKARLRNCRRRREARARKNESRGRRRNRRQ